MNITKQQLKRIIKEELSQLREAVTADDEKRSREYWATAQGRETAKSMTRNGEPEGGLQDKSVEVWEVVQQNVEEPSFAEFLGKELETGPDPEMIMDAVQQNLNDPRFVDWLYKELSLDGYL